MKKLLLVLLMAAINVPVMAHVDWLQDPEGKRENARLKLPPRYHRYTDMPLVLNLHGLGGSIALQRVLTRLERDVRSMGFAILTPNGTFNSKGERFWNAGPACCDFENSGVDDGAYIQSMIKLAQERYPMLSKNNIYFLGHSNGGFLAYNLACRYPGQFKGLISIAGSMETHTGLGEVIDNDAASCSTPFPFNVVHVHGLLDKTVPYNGTVFGSNGFASVNNLMKRWLHQLNCNVENGLEYSFHKNAALFNPGLDAKVYQAKNCSLGDLWLVQLPDSGHVPILRKRFFKWALRKIMNE